MKRGRPALNQLREHRLASLDEFMEEQTNKIFDYLFVTMPFAEAPRGREAVMKLSRLERLQEAIEDVNDSSFDFEYRH